MTYRERSAWICLLSILVVQGPYFAWSTPLFLAGPVRVAQVLPALTLAVFLQAVFSAVAHLLVARKDGNGLSDERDEVIAAASVRRAYVVLSLAMLPMFVVAMSYESTIGVAALVQLVLAAWVLAELVRYGSQCRDYRRSVAGLGDLGA